MYLYPEDVVVTTVDGKKEARLKLECTERLWTDRCLELAKTNVLKGWQMAGEEYRKVKQNEWVEKRQRQLDFWEAKLRAFNFTGSEPPDHPVWEMLRTTRYE